MIFHSMKEENKMKNGFRLTKRGAIALVLLAVLLAGAVWLNIKLGADGTGVNAPGEDAANTAAPKNDGDGSSQTVNANVYSGYFVNFRDERSSVRAQEIEYLRMILQDETSDAETVAGAQERLMQLVSNMEKEFSIESQIRAKGFLDAAVTFRNDSVTVVIDGETLTEEEVARILDIIRNETGVSASAVRISLSKGSV